MRVEPWHQSKPTALLRAQWSAAGICAQLLQTSMVQSLHGCSWEGAHVHVYTMNCLQAGEGKSSHTAMSVTLSTSSTSEGFHFKKGKLVGKFPASQDCSGMTAGLMSK